MDKSQDRPSSVNSPLDVLMWTARMSSRRSPAWMVVRVVLAVTSALLVCVSCYALWWATDRIGAAWHAPGKLSLALWAVGAVAASLVVIQVLVGAATQVAESRSHYALQLLLARQYVDKLPQIDLATIESAGNEDLLGQRSGLQHTACGVMDAAVAGISTMVQGAGLLVLYWLIGWPAMVVLGVLLVLGILWSAVGRGPRRGLRTGASPTGA